MSRQAIAGAVQFLRLQQLEQSHIRVSLEKDYHSVLNSLTAHCDRVWV